VRISQKLEYACRAIIQLAQHHDGETLTRLEELAQREAVSSSFLVQILNDLKRGGVVTSKRGKSGGYLLSRAPKDISLLDITRAVEPGMFIANTTNDGESGNTVSQTWQQISEKFEKDLLNITVDTLSDQSPMFYI